MPGAWPADLGGADRVDPEKGPVKAISGTSMATPDVAGATALLAMLFGVTKTGNPRMRYLLVEAAWCILRSRSPQTQELREWADRVATRRGRRVAEIG